MAGLRVGLFCGDASPIPRTTYVCVILSPTRLYPTAPSFITATILLPIILFKNVRSPVVVFAGSIVHPRCQTKSHWGRPGDRSTILKCADLASFVLPSNLLKRAPAPVPCTRPHLKKMEFEICFSNQLNLHSTRIDIPTVNLQLSWFAA